MNLTVPDCPQDSKGTLFDLPGGSSKTATWPR